MRAIASLVAAAIGLACSPPRTRPVVAAAPTAAPGAPSRPRTPLEGGATDADVRHALGRLGFGARPGEIARVRALGLRRWLDAQLAAGTDPAAEAALAPFRFALAPSDELVDEAAISGKRDLLLATQMTAIARHVAGERQVAEVLVDVWTNHFNVSARKGRVRFLVAGFIETAIRPHALGRFEDLLLATARHPAMLLYLDNARSLAPRPGSRAAQRGRGLNENYARELLELHTLGVAGGYTQDDVREVARVLTGWSVADNDFVFRGGMHDAGRKRVLGALYGVGTGAATGEAEGVALLRALAAHPATAQHVSRVLCTRLVADDPPAACVAAAVAAWQASGGTIAEVVRAIAAEPGFWDPAVRAGKLRTPLELVVASVRAVGGEVDGAHPTASDGLAKLVTRLGQPLLVESVPTGYSDRGDAWLSTAGALQRIDFALALAGGKLPGVRYDLGALVPAGAPLADAVDRALLGGEMTAQTRRAIDDAVRATPNREQARRLAIALALASPEAQLQ